MSFIIALLIILLVWIFLIAPFVRLIRASRQWRDAFNGATRQQQTQNQANRQRSRQNPRQSKKKIDPTVGEYVEFTETTVDTTADKTGRSDSTTVETESQITDVTWEDLPEK